MPDRPIKETKLTTIKAPLKLQYLFFPMINCCALPQETSENARMPKPKIIRAIPKYNEDYSNCSVTLTIKSEERSEETKLLYEYELVVFGSFEWIAEKPEDEDYLLKSLAVTGASILYSSAREMLYQISSRGPWKPCMLPAVAFRPEIQIEAAELKVTARNNNIPKGKKLGVKKTKE